MHWPARTGGNPIRRSPASCMRSCVAERNYRVHTGGLQSERPSSARDHRLFRPPAERQTMKMHYDEQVDALYLSLDESDVVESEEVKPGIILDFNAAGEVVGIEVLDVKRRVPSADLKQLEFEVASASGS